MPWWAWMALGAVLLCSELFIDSEFYLAIFGFASLAVGFGGFAGLINAPYTQVALFASISGVPAPEDVEETPLTVLLPAFMLSELRVAFEIGFMIYLPFLVIDLVVASMLISMGMIVLPPIVISLPFKLMLFVLLDGWNLVIGSLVKGLS